MNKSQYIHTNLKDQTMKTIKITLVAIALLSLTMPAYAMRRVATRFATMPKAIQYRSYAMMTGSEFENITHHFQDGCELQLFIDALKQTNKDHDDLKELTDRCSNILDYYESQVQKNKTYSENAGGLAFFGGAAIIPALMIGGCLGVATQSTTVLFAPLIVVGSSIIILKNIDAYQAGALDYNTKALATMKEKYAYLEHLSRRAHENNRRANIHYAKTTRKKD